MYYFSTDLTECEEVSPGSLRIFRGDFKGKNESFIYKGYYQNKTPVAVRKFPNDNATERDRDRIALLTPQNIHENFLRFISFDSHGTDKYLMTILYQLICRQ
jgi:hypothetical protein